MNIVLTSVGRRSYLVQYFRNALQGKGIVIATNSVADSPGMAAADVSCVVPNASKERFLGELLSICVKHKAKLLLSLHDWEAPFIAEHLDRFRAIGAIPAVSPPEVIRLCLDKMQTYEFAKRNGIAHPHTVSTTEEAFEALQSGKLRLPLVVKPRFGQGSLGIETVLETADLHNVSRLIKNRLRTSNDNRLLSIEGKDCLIFQEKITGEEFNVDVINDFKGKFVSSIAIRKLGMRNGETDAAVAIRDQPLEDFGKQIGTALRHIGALDVDLMVRDGTPYLLDMNPRIGGAYPFAHEAGADIPSAYIAWASGKKPKSSWFRVKHGVKSYKDITVIADLRNQKQRNAIV